MLDVRRLHILRELALRGSIRSAAQALNYSTSAASQHLAALEREAGVVLLERGRNTVRLTDAGRALVEHADTILAQIAAAETALQAIAGLRGGSLVLASFASAAMVLVPDAIRAFAAEFPEVELTFVEADPEHTLPMLKAGDVDVALVYEYDYVALRPEAGLSYRRLVDEPVRLAVPRGHWAANRPAVPLGELSEESWIVEPRADCRHFTLRACDAAGFDARVWGESSDYRVTQTLVAAGSAVALVPALALCPPHPDVVVLPIEDPEPHRSVLAAHRQAAGRVPAVRAMLDVLAATAASTQVA